MYIIDVVPIPVIQFHLAPIKQLVMHISADLVNVESRKQTSIQ